MKTRIFFIAILICSLLNLNFKKTAKSNEIRQLWLDCKINAVLSFDIFNTAIHGLHEIENIKKKNIITIIDYSKPSTEKRFFVIDIEEKKLLYNCFVAHGKNSGENIAISFSNEPNSLQSCLGFFLTAETYIGENGYSMKLDGLEKSINDNSRAREIVIHGADYVRQEYINKYGRLGRSWGCPALPLELSKEIIDRISQGSCIFIYGNDASYRENSNFISGSNIEK